MIDTKNPAEVTRDPRMLDRDVGDRRSAEVIVSGSQLKCWRLGHCRVEAKLAETNTVSEAMPGSVRKQQ